LIKLKLKNKLNKITAAKSRLIIGFIEVVLMGLIGLKTNIYFLGYP